MEREYKKAYESKFNNGLFIYPYFRFPILQSENETQLEAHHFGTITTGNIVLSLIKNWRKLFFRKRPIAFFSSTLFEIKDDKGRYYNSLDGYYYSLFPDKSIIIEDSDSNYQWRSDGSQYAFSGIITFITFFSKVCASISIRFLKNPQKYSFKDFEKAFPNFSHLDLIYRDIYSAIFYKLCLWLLKRMECRVCFINCASYGGDRALLCKAANDLGLMTIELQHGLFTQNSSIYQDEGFWVNEDMRSYLPKEIWVFGDFWGKQISLPVKIINVGNPGLSRRVPKCLSLNNNNQKYFALIISQPIEYDKFVQFTLEFARMYPDKKFLYRFHPTDDKEFLKKKLCIRDNISFTSSETDLYSDIISSEHVVGMSSTCLIESLALGHWPIIIDTCASRKDFIDEIGVWCKSPEEIQFDCKEEKIDTSLFWLPFDSNKVKQIISDEIGIA